MAEGNGGAPRAEGGGEEAVPEIRITDRRRVTAGADATRPASEAGEPGDASVEAPEQRDELEEARRQAAEYLDHLQRLKAEFENYRKRILREQTQAVELASQGLVLRMLEVLDEFELALIAADQNPDPEKFLRGVEMVYGKLVDILGQEGLERIPAQGQPFDPGLHEALLQTQDDDDGEPYVADVLRTGYRLRGHVIRPAGVKVGRR